MSAKTSAAPAPLSIKVSFNYERFKTIKGNRTVAHRVARMVQEIGWKDQSRRYPILVFKDSDGKLAIADGQKRFEALMQLAKPIYYIECPEEILIEEIARANSQQTGWSLQNYLEYNVALNRPHYLKLQDFVRTYDFFSLSIAIEIVGGTLSNGSQADAFKCGEFIARNLGQAQLVASVLRSLRPLLSFRLDRGLVLAITRCVRLPQFEVSRFLHKARRQSDRLVKCSNWRAYLRVIEEVYNNHARSEDVLPIALKLKGKAA